MNDYQNKYIFRLLMVFLIPCLMFPLQAQSQMVYAERIPEFGATFGVDVNRVRFDVRVQVIKSSVEANVYTPGEPPEMIVQLVNNTEEKQFVSGQIDIIAYGTRGRPGDVWTPEMFPIDHHGSIPIHAELEPLGYQNIIIQPGIPERFGAYALVADLGKHHRQFLTSVVRTFAFEPKKIQYPTFCLDGMHPGLLMRLGVHSIRFGIEYKPTTAHDFEDYYQRITSRLREYEEANISVLIKMGAGADHGDYLPLGTIRPWLDENNYMLQTKSDYAWKPEYDNDFKKLITRLATDFGWPHGPVNAFALWNEPWEGISISGWGADMLRYREIYSKMAEGVKEARDSAGVDVLTGGCSSTSNALDKLFPDGNETFLDDFDFCSIHYQGLSPYSGIKSWIHRKSPRGRVKIWDTESWVANTDDRVSTVVATNRASGYDRAMGIYYGNIARVRNVIYREGNTTLSNQIVDAWSVAASIGAVQKFVGERIFNRLLFQNGLPWIMVFDGYEQNPDDGTLVITGDIGDAFGHDYTLFRTVYSLKEMEEKEKVREIIKTLDPVADAEEIQTRALHLQTRDRMTGGSMEINNTRNLYRLYDFYGNEIISEKGKIIVPLNHQGYFLRTDGSTGSFASLVEAIQNSRIEGYEPVESIIYDFTSPIHENPIFTIRLTNILNRPLKGVLDLEIENLMVDAPRRRIRLDPHQTIYLQVKVAGKPSSDNTYPLRLEFNAGKDGRKIHYEDLHVNFIAQKTLNIDGNLDDWEGIVPLPVKASGSNRRSFTEEAWFPFLNFDEQVNPGFANGYLAYDDDYLFFAAKIADDTHDKGMRRFEGGDEDYCFYPDTVYRKDTGTHYSIRWSGRIKPPHSGKYTFYTNSDDGVRLWVNNELLIDNWTHHGPTIDFNSIELESEKMVEIRMDYYQAGGGASAQLFWESEQISRQIIPAHVLFSQENNTPTGNGLTAEMYNGIDFNTFRTIRIDPIIDFEFTDEQVPDPEFLNSPAETLVWPEDIRRFSYRANPELPAGNFPNHDNVQIAFNVLNDEEKKMYPNPPGTPRHFANYQCTDYEYALNTIAAEFGGGTEVVRLRHPEMPLKHHFPRQPKSPLDGAVHDALLVVSHTGNTRVVEAAIPWHEIPHVKEKMAKGEPVKFSFRVNDNTDRGCMELSRMRSVAKRNSSFQVDWIEHWANELEFVFEK